VADQVLTRDGPVSVPMDYQVPQGGELLPLTVNATMDGTSAAAPFYAAVQIIAPSGRVMATAISTSIAAGASASVTWFPWVASQQAGGGALPILDFVAFTPAGNQLEITSTNPAAPTTVVTTAPVTFTGTETVQIQFYASAIDLDQRGLTGLAGVLLELYVDNTALGIIGDYNADAGLYFVTTCYAAAFDLPSAGAHTYSIRGWKQVGGGTGPGQSFVYGTGVSTPHATRPGFLVILLAS
jgi:hypothetical protein